jgi:phage-related tail fiber protein
VRATQDWVEGRMSTEQHKRIHNRANHVLSNKKPHEFKGKSGERMPKKGSLGW